MKAVPKKGVVPEIKIHRHIIDVEFTGDEVLALTLHEKLLFENANTKEALLNSCSDNLYGLSNLTSLALRKLVTNITSEKGIIYGRSSQRTILHLAAAVGDFNLISELLGFNAFEMGKLCNSIPSIEHKQLVAGIINEILGDALTNKIDINNPAFDEQLIGEAILNKFKSENDPLDAFIKIFKDEMGDNYNQLPYEQCFIHNQVWIDTLDKKDSEDKTPLHWAAVQGGTTVLAEMLKHTKGRVALSVLDNNNNTPLQCATLNLDTAAIDLILKTDEGKRSLLKADHLGYTPLHWAASLGKSACIDVMLKTDEGKKALSIPTHNGDTPLHFATLRGGIETQILIKNGAVPNLLMLFNNTFCNEINKKMRENYIRYLSSTTQNIASQTAQFISNAMAGYALANYMNENKQEAEGQGRY